MKKRYLLYIIFSCFSSIYGQIKWKPNILTETGGVASIGENAPFWIYSNQYGIFTPNNNTAYFRTFVHSEGNKDNKFDLKYGLDVYGRGDTTATYQINQAYLSFRAYFIVAKIGTYRQTYGNQDPILSSGSIIFSNNARPYPKISLGIPEYYTVPFTKDFLEIKGEVTHGWAENYNRWVHDSYIHYKYAYVQLGGRFPLHINMGYHHAIQWGGVSSNYGKQPSSIKDLAYLFFAKNPPNAIAPQSETLNEVGNHIGSRQYGIDYSLSNKLFGSYYQTVFEDNSGNRWLSKDGDGLWGLFYKDKDEKAVVKSLVLEFLKTTYQSGPIDLIQVTIDSVTFWDTRTGGNDNYFNNYLYQSWSYFGNTIGTPFITSPNLINKNANTISNNRVLAYHIGGLFAIKKMLLKTMYSYSVNKGTYGMPFSKDVEQHAFMINVNKKIPQLRDIEFSFTLGIDYGKLVGSNLGCGISIQKTF